MSHGGLNAVSEVFHTDKNKILDETLFFLASKWSNFKMLNISTQYVFSGFSLQLISTFKTHIGQPSRVIYFAYTISVYCQIQLAVS